MTEPQRLPPTPEVVDLWSRTDAVGFLQGWIDGVVPADPHVAHTGNRLVEVVEPGHVVHSWQTGPQLANLAGAVHGGYLALVCDESCGLAGASLGERFRPMLTMDLDVSYLRPGLVGATYRIDGRVLHAGGTRVLAESRITDPDGRLIATARASVVPNRSFSRG